MLRRLTSAPGAPPLTELVVLLGDDHGISHAEIEMAEAVGTRASAYSRSGTYVRTRGRKEGRKEESASQSVRDRWRGGALKSSGGCNHTYSPYSGAATAGGGAVLRASLGAGCLLASQCVVVSTASIASTASTQACNRRHPGLQP